MLIPVILVEPAKGALAKESLVPFTIVILPPAELVMVKFPPAIPLAVTSVMPAALISAAISTASAAVVPNVAVPEVVVVKLTKVPLIVALNGGPPPTIPNASPTLFEVVTLKGPVPVSYTHLTLPTKVTV